MICIADSFFPSISTLKAGRTHYICDGSSDKCMSNISGGGDLITRDPSGVALGSCGSFLCLRELEECCI